MAFSPEAINFREAIRTLYSSDHYFRFLDIEFRELDDEHFRFGTRYRCIRSFCANGLGPHEPDFGKAEVGETMWFIGFDYFAWDGLHAMFFHDGTRLRDFVFSDAQWEVEGRINKAFKDAPLSYFEMIGDGSEIGMALAALREDLFREKREKWPRFVEREQLQSPLPSQPRQS
jgi:hypothetical protein